MHLIVNFYLDKRHFNIRKYMYMYDPVKEFTSSQMVVYNEI